MADSQGKSGIATIQSFTKEELMLCIGREDLVESVNVLKDIYRTGSNAEKIQAIRLIWDKLVPDAKKEVDMGGDMEIKIIREIIDEHTENEVSEISEQGVI
jgi:hypothetical protein